MAEGEVFDVTEPAFDFAGFADDACDFILGKERGLAELLLRDFVVEVCSRTALAFGFAELAVLAGDELTAACPRFFGLLFDVAVRPIEEANETDAVGCDAVEARLVDCVFDFFDVREFFAEFAICAEGVES